MKGIGSATNARKLKNRVELIVVPIVISYSAAALISGFYLCYITGVRHQISCSSAFKLRH